MKRTGIIAVVLAAIAGAGAILRVSAPAGPDPARMAALYAEPLPPPDKALAVFHIGHSLVNRDMPAMLAQLAGDGHRYESQLGWGAPMRAHWGDTPVNGFEEENAHPRFRPAREAVESGDYDVVVLTEAVEIRDSIRYHDSANFLAAFAEAALKARPDSRLYLYESWHALDDPDGWLNRIDLDLQRYWLDEILKPALGRLPEGTRIHLIPAGRAMAALAREVEARGGVGSVKDRTGLFRDQIHLNDLGNYYVALVHYAVIYQKSPIGLPHALRKGDGTPAKAPEPELAILMQELAWSIARSTPLTGVAP
ncbi:MAG: hypothetical protein JNK34_10060 [Tabrizicola sp.]|nr:hypothetical protein [Tabrizicola sp.]